MVNNKNYLSVVVLFWNDSEKTIKCLNSIFNQNKIYSILVDNNSRKKYSNKILNGFQKNIKYKKYYKV